MENIQLLEEQIANRIYLIRDKKVMIDRDIAKLYNVETRILNQAVKRNLKRFPSDFMFQMSEVEMKNWISQFVISKSLKMSFRTSPYAFTEHGIAMLSSVLKSRTAINVNIQIIRVFTRMRELLASDQLIMSKLEELEKQNIKQDHKIKLIFDFINTINENNSLNESQKKRKRIGY